MGGGVPHKKPCSLVSCHISLVGNLNYYTLYCVHWKHLWMERQLSFQHCSTLKGEFMMKLHGGILCVFLLFLHTFEEVVIIYFIYLLPEFISVSFSSVWLSWDSDTLVRIPRCKQTFFFFDRMWFQTVKSCSGFWDKCVSPYLALKAPNQSLSPLMTEAHLALSWLAPKARKELGLPQWEVGNWSFEVLYVFPLMSSNSLMLVYI